MRLSRRALVGHGVAADTTPVTEVVGSLGELLPCIDAARQLGLDVEVEPVYDVQVTGGTVDMVTRTFRFRAHRRLDRDAIAAVGIEEGDER